MSVDTGGKAPPALEGSGSSIRSAKETSLLSRFQSACKAATLPKCNAGHACSEVAEAAVKPAEHKTSKMSKSRTYTKCRQLELGHNTALGFLGALRLLSSALTLRLCLCM
eukprot:6205152-Amphidinium_carterae.1